MGIVVIGSVFVDIKGFPISQYIPRGRNAGRVVTVHGGVARNVVEDLANVQVKPSFISLVDDSGMGRDVLEHLKRHKVDTSYVRVKADAMGTWLAVFDNNGDVVASISKRPDTLSILDILEEKGEEIFSQADSLVVEMDMEEEVLGKIIELARVHGKEVYGLVSNMSIAMERRDMIVNTACFVCNVQEAELFFSEDYSHFTPEQILAILPEKIRQAGIRRMVVTLGGEGAVFASADGAEAGYVPASKVDVIDTTGCGDAFCAGIALGLTYLNSLSKACEIGTRLASAVVATRDSVCPRFRPAEFGLEGFEEG